ASLMVRKKVLDELGGYDESLAYEDFDFWVRSSRNYKYAYLDASLVKHRKFKGSLSTMFLRSGKESMLETTYKVCCKALWLNKNADENHALCQRLYYEMKQTFFMENFALAKKYRQLIKEAGRVSFRSSVISLLSDMKFRTNWLYAFYLRMKGRL
ncbi:MAG: glycosyltransferase family 2 protein, partial [Cytophagaceae bacterium]